MKNGTIYSIQYIRGIAALLVVFFHFRSNLNGVYAQENLGNLLFRWGEVGVDAFFLISGFIICYATRTDKSKISFLLKRFFRIYPVYILFIVIFMAISLSVGRRISHEDIINAIFILPANYDKGSPFFGYSFLSVAWSLFYEIMFYLLFLLSMAISHKYRVYICSIVIISFTVLLQLYFNGEFSISARGGIKESNLGIINIASSSMMLIFIAGMLLYEVMRNFGDKIANNVNCKLLFYISLITFTYCYFTGFNSWHGIDRSILFIFPLIFSLILLEINNDERKEIKWLSFLGDISYSLYLCHLIVALFYRSYGGSFYASSSGFSRLLLLVGTSIVIAYIAHKYIEKPSIKLCRKILSK
ncbi:acyltransferase [Proteus mirabilis]|uniref:acyltransferase family protein n=1 Tax=Proteus mirabilis TaxID=584 RepID=UPI00254DA966|nr:acyltransferase [Proteus mirabilis]MDK6201165.1 acyltransferase [Proteus mirabilis]